MSDNVTPRDLLDRALDLLSDEASDMAEWRADLDISGDEERELFAECMKRLNIKTSFLYRLYDLLDEMEND